MWLRGTCILRAFKFEVSTKAGKKKYYHTASYRACPDLVQDFRYPTHGIKVFEEYLAVAFCTDALEI